MAKLSLYLNFAGNTEAAFQYYRSIFGGEFHEVKRFSDTPFGAHMPEPERNMIMHIAYPIGNLTLMGTDTLASQGHSLSQGNNFSVIVDAQDKFEAERFFYALALQGKVTMPMQDTFWGGYFGMCVDQFGVQWMIQWVNVC